MCGHGQQPSDNDFHAIGLDSDLPYVTPTNGTRRDSMQLIAGQSEAGRLGRDHGKGRRTRDSAAIAEDGVFDDDGVVDDSSLSGTSGTFFKSLWPLGFSMSRVQ